MARNIQYGRHFFRKSPGGFKGGIFIWLLVANNWRPGAENEDGKLFLDFTSAYGEL